MRNARLCSALLLSLLTADVASAGKGTAKRALDDAQAQIEAKAFPAATGRLDAIDPEDLEGKRGRLLRQRYALLRGLVALNTEDYRAAVSNLRKVVDMHRADRGDMEGFDPLVYIYLGRAHFYADELQAALNALNVSGETGDAMAGVWQLRGEALRRLGRLDAARAELEKGRARHGDASGFGFGLALVEIDARRTPQALALVDGLLASDDVSAGELVMLADEAVAQDGAVLAFRILERTVDRLEASGRPADEVAAVRSKLADLRVVRLPDGPDLRSSEGGAKVRLVLGEDGTIERADVEGADSPELAEALREGVGKWTGQTERGEVEITVIR